MLFRLKKHGGALVYMGHGNTRMAQGSYYELELAMNRMYDVPVVIGLVEGQPDIDVVISKLMASGAKKVLLKPLMIVAGDHANNDMAGDEDDSWNTVLTKAGFSVMPILEGLGDKKQIRRIFINHINEAAKNSWSTAKINMKEIEVSHLTKNVWKECSSR